MTVLTSQLPSGGYGYTFPSVEIKPFTFLELTGYLENIPTDPLEKYIFDIKVLCKDDPKVNELYVMDLDFLIFFKKLCTVSADLSYDLTLTCPNCGSKIKRTITLDRDIHFTQIDKEVMNGAFIELNGHKYEVEVPTVRDFLQVLTKYVRYRRISDLKMIKTIALIKEFRTEGNQVEEDVLGATHNDITLLVALRELYYDRVELIEVFCPECNKNREGRGISVSVDSLIGDFFETSLTIAQLMELKFYLNKFAKVDNIEQYTYNNVLVLKDIYMNFLDKAEGKDPDFPGMQFGEKKGKKISVGKNVYSMFDEEDIPDDFNGIESLSLGRI